jgi:hypothetical protein
MLDNSQDYLNVEVFGIIYIYNQPDREKLGTGTAGAEAPAADRPGVEVEPSTETIPETDQPAEPPAEPSAEPPAGDQVPPTAAQPGTGEAPAAAPANPATPANPGAAPPAVAPEGTGG